MAKLHARPSNQYRYEHYDPWGRKWILQPVRRCDGGQLPRLDLRPDPPGGPALAPPA